MKSENQNFKWLFQIEDDGRIGGKCTCVYLIAMNYIGIKITKHCDIPFGFRKGKSGDLVFPSSELYLVLDEFS